MIRTTIPISESALEATFGTLVKARGAMLGTSYQCALDATGGMGDFADETASAKGAWKSCLAKDRVGRASDN